MSTPNSNSSFQLQPKETAALFTLLSGAAQALGSGQPLSSVHTPILHQLLNTLPLIVSIPPTEQFLLKQAHGRLTAHFGQQTGILPMTNVATNTPTTPPVSVLPTALHATTPPVHPASIKTMQ